MSEIEEEIGELRARLDALSERVRLSEVARRFAEGNHEVRDGDFVKFSDGHTSRVRIGSGRHDQKWIPPEKGIERLYTIQEVGEILAQALRARAQIGGGS